MASTSNGNLVASHPENTSAARHGPYSGRLLAERGREVRDSLLTLAHLSELIESDRVVVLVDPVRRG